LATCSVEPSCQLMTSTLLPADDQHPPAVKRRLPDLRLKRAVITGQLRGNLGEGEAREVRHPDFEPPPGIMALNRRRCPKPHQSRPIGVEVASAADDRDPELMAVRRDRAGGRAVLHAGVQVPLRPVPTMWTLLAACKAAAVACSTSAGDFFSGPLVGALVEVAAPPQALAVRVASAAIPVAAVTALARRISFIEIILLMLYPPTLASFDP
jgi:hypothetical protein